MEANTSEKNEKKAVDIRFEYLEKILSLIVAKLNENKATD